MQKLECVCKCTDAFRLRSVVKTQWCTDAHARCVMLWCSVMLLTILFVVEHRSLGWTVRSHPLLPLAPVKHWCSALIPFSATERLMLLGVSETRCDDDYRCRDSHTESRSCSNWLCVCECVCVWAPAAATISTSPPSSRARARATNMFHISLPRCDIKERKHVCYVDLQHKYSHNGIFHEIESYASSERWINNISIDVWFGQYLKIWNLRVQKNLNIEKIIFKVVLCNAYY